MRLRRTFAVYVLTLAMCLLFLGNHARQGTAPTTKKYDGELTIATPAEPSAGPSAVTVATPKGRVTVQPAALGRYDIPSTALLAYQRAADILAEVKPGCALRWTLLAAIGRVESDHGRYGASNLGTDGVSTPQVVGVPLNGQGPVATIADTDAGAVDGDPRWDHAVGPMQFIPSTWDVVAVDGDGDGVRSIDDIDDAALAAGIYLCAASESLSVDASVEAALHRYNDSDSYVALVMAYERKYAGGDFTVTSPDGGLVVASAALTSHPLAGTPMQAATPAEARLQEGIKAAARHASAAAEKTGGRTPGISSATAPAAVPAAVTTPSEARGAQAAAAASGGVTPAAPGGPSPSAAGTPSPGTSGPASPTAPGTSPSTPAGTTPSSPNATPGAGVMPPPSSPDPSSPGTGTPTSSSPSTGSGSPDVTPSQPAPPPSQPAPGTSDPGAGGTGSSPAEPTPTQTQTPDPSPTKSPDLPPCDPATTDPQAAAASPDPQAPDPEATCVPQPAAPTAVGSP